jgi:hypothetical protein
MYVCDYSHNARNEYVILKLLPQFSGYTDTLLYAGVSLVSYSLHHHNHHRHYLVNTELPQLWTRSGLTHPEVSLMFSPGFFCPLVCIFYYPW